jgi:phosphoserine aminotransferase
MKRIFNFGAGPATLPVPVLEEASRGVLEIGGSGMSILEVSHRSKEYEAIHFDARDRLLAALGLDGNEYNALFLGGGASQQFAMLAQNFLGGGKADYINTGEWSTKAIKEAKRFGSVNVVGSSEDKKFSYIPKAVKWDADAKYAHITTNNTIEGTEWETLPDVGNVPLIGDASSDILGRAYDYKKFALLYAGAQKNLGPAGVTVVVIKKSFLEKASEDLPVIYQYKTHAKADSLYNTPPAFAIYTVGLVLKWVAEQGGVAGLDKRNRARAGRLYAALDELADVYDPAVTAKEDRSVMNVTFRLRDASKEKDFLAGAQAKGLDGLKGHRSVGGFRASIYNAMPDAGVDALCDYVRAFAKK